MIHGNRAGFYNLLQQHTKHFWQASVTSRPSKTDGSLTWSCLLPNFQKKVLSGPSVAFANCPKSSWRRCLRFITAQRHITKFSRSLKEAIKVWVMVAISVREFIHARNDKAATE